MKTLILALLSTSLFFGAYAAEKPAKKENPAKTDKAQKGKKAKGEKVTVIGALKCGHCDFKIGDTCASVIKTEKGLYFIKGKLAKKFSKENPKAEKVEASGLAKKDGDNYAMRVTKIGLKE